jgi:hypothetical protein
LHEMNVHHGGVPEEIKPPEVRKEHIEIWLEAATDHGHFHAGEEVRLKLYKGYNMKPSRPNDNQLIRFFKVDQSKIIELELNYSDDHQEFVMDQQNDGIIQIYAQAEHDKTLYAKIVFEIGHHHHNALKPIGLPLEILPLSHNHARIGQHYQVQVLRDKKPWPGAEIRITFTGTRHADYPHHLIADDEGKAGIFLSARGNYLFSVQNEDIISTFTLMKN